MSKMVSSASGKFQMDGIGPINISEHLKKSSRRLSRIVLTEKTLTCNAIWRPMLQGRVWEAFYCRPRNQLRLVGHNRNNFRAPTGLPFITRMSNAGYPTAMLIIQRRFQEPIYGPVSAFYDGRLTTAASIDRRPTVAFFIHFIE